MFGMLAIAMRGAARPNKSDAVAMRIAGRFLWSGLWFLVSFHHTRVLALDAQQLPPNQTIAPRCGLDPKVCTTIIIRSLLPLPPQ